MPKLLDKTNKESEDISIYLNMTRALSELEKAGLEKEFATKIIRSNLAHFLEISGCCIFSYAMDYYPSIKILSVCKSLVTPQQQRLQEEAFHLIMKFMSADQNNLLSKESRCKALLVKDIVVLASNTIKLTLNYQ